MYECFDSVTKHGALLFKWIIILFFKIFTRVKIKKRGSKATARLSAMAAVAI